MNTARTAAVADVGRLPDLVLLSIAVALLLIGLIAITSASVGYAEATYGNMWHHSYRHLVYLGLALMSGFICYQVPIELWYRSGWLLLLLSSLLLILVLIPGVGRNVNGSQRWLALGSMTLQPSELAKAAMIVYLSGYLVRQGKALQESWQGVLRPLMILGLVAVLLLAEPDFGAVVIMFATAFGMLFLAGMRLMHLGLIIAATGVLGALLIQAAPYRLQRLIAYTDPWADPFGSGFQLIQSLIAFGRGEWFGVGLGNSVQKLFYLPEAHTDFVFSIWAEETGFAGAFVLIALFLALVLRIFHLGREAQKEGQLFSAYLCFGVSLMFSGQAFVNMGVSAGLLPTKGLTLPLISYGGTSLITACVLLSMVLRVAHERQQPARGRKR
ncbi:putative lipid II flippase FtsW [Congregibacter brevis]|uniref:Probable peptidoglycan glycosyltransferase FtsW n=1 Tax=Congregibacter brevis TaxID=3081201 RepID=A0ABZ0IH82_9GAMM|nr:putative lipid II flippase FtsW [Congregibacter sp. IMCC45268]